MSEIKSRINSMGKRVKKTAYTFEIIDWQNGIIRIPDNILNKLEKNGSLQITLTESDLDVFKELKIERSSFIKIKETQDLPDEVVIKFMLAEASLAKTDFGKREKK